MFYVYLISTKNDSNTYVGATIDVKRRLLQHNSLKSGGAKRTTNLSKDGKNVWRLVCYVQGFPEWTAALQFEWRWKQLTRQLSNYKFTPLQKRMMALEELLNLPKPTSRATILYADYPEGGCKVIYSDGEATEPQQQQPPQQPKLQN